MKTLFFLFATIFSVAAYAQNQTVNIYFDKLSADIRPEGYEKLDQLSRLIKADSTTIQRISVYSDTLGTTELNGRLANERYVNVMKTLGIDRDNVNFEVNIYGEEFPFVESDYQKELFRRVTIVHFVKEEIIEEIIEEVVEEVIEEPIEEPSKLLTDLEQFALDPNKEETLVQLSILFEGDKDILLEGSEKELDELHKFLLEHPTYTAHIRGHVCCKSNKKLSKQRAARVYNYLVMHTINKDRLSYKGYSNKEPFIKPELTEFDRQANRRVDVVFKK